LLADYQRLMTDLLKQELAAAFAASAKERRDLR
jgi:hypothetical protein